MPVRHALVLYGQTIGRFVGTGPLPLLLDDGLPQIRERGKHPRLRDLPIGLDELPECPAKKAAARRRRARS